MPRLDSLCSLPCPLLLLPSPPAPGREGPEAAMGEAGVLVLRGSQGSDQIATESVASKMQCGRHALVSLPGDQPATCRCVPWRARAHHITPAAQLGRASLMETHGAANPPASRGNLSILSKCPVSAVRFSAAP